MAGLQPEFEKRNCKIAGLSVDPVTSHGKWMLDIEETQGHKVNHSMIGDPELHVAKLYNMLPADAGSTSEGRTVATNATVRTGVRDRSRQEDQADAQYPMSTGRNFDEIAGPSHANAVLFRSGEKDGYCSGSNVSCERCGPRCPDKE
jgi:alkyl hydroperoxide reductase subunit AhpC